MQGNTRSINNNKGFNLFELITCLMIMSVIFCVGWSASNHAYKAIFLQHELEDALLLAQREVQIKHMPIVFCLSQSQYNCSHFGKQWLVFIDEKMDGIVRNKSQLITVKQLSVKGTLYLRSYPKYRDFLLFSPGQPFQNDNSTFWYCLESAKTPEWALTFSRSGRVRKNTLIKDLTC